MAYAGRNEGYNVAAAVAGDETPARSVAHCSLVFRPCSLHFRLAVVACVAQCAAVGSAGAVEAGNIVADIDDGHNAYAVAAGGGGRSAFGAGHILEASGEEEDASVAVASVLRPAAKAAVAVSNLVPPRRRERQRVPRKCFSP